MSDAQRTSKQIRAQFLAFFREKGHEVVGSSPIVPRDDPTLLFINAGMNQFKDVFLGLGSRSYRRAADTQKCLRVSGKHNDLEEVGLDTYHHTFFEMLGNWSFGDYFKSEAIEWAWELLTNRWGIDGSRLYATVHGGDPALNLEADREAEELWKRHLPSDRILRCPSNDNFWMMGDTGPCGPCSEIHIDLRPEDARQRVSGQALINKDDPLVIELWNLVFIQYDARTDGSLVPLADSHVDTGMGLERLVSVLQGKLSNYDTDLFAPLLKRIADLSPLEALRGYDDIEDGENREAIRVAMRVVADHIRAIAFAICDGAPPGNVGRGYVIRRILRRASRCGYQVLGLREPFLFRLVAPLVELMGEQFPDLVSSRKRIESNVRAEEASFLRTLGKGMKLFECLLPHLKQKETDITLDPRSTDLLRKAYSGADAWALFRESARRGVVPGEVAFLLHDTYGFPIDLTQLMACEEGLDVDMGRYAQLMTGQRTRARDAGKFRTAGHGDQRPDAAEGWMRIGAGDDSYFLGYTCTAAADAAIRLMRTSTPYAVVLDRTPFYAEAGGQVGDIGMLLVGDDKLRVLDTQSHNGRIVHRVDRLPEYPDAPVQAVVDAARRARIAKHHTATHLIHAAFRESLGLHVVQKGSLVAPDHLRFDFSHYERVGREELKRIQERVNEVIRSNIAASIEEDVPYAEAVERGAMALFGEKYGDRVRVVTFDADFSLELCGGTHVDATGEIGLFLLRSEGSVAAGVRRVEAVAGADALGVVQREFDELGRIRSLVKGKSASEVVERLVQDAKRLGKQVEEMRRDRLAFGLDAIVSTAKPVGDVRLAAGRIQDTDMGSLRVLGAALRSRLGPGSVGLLGTADPNGGKAYLVATVSDDLVSRGLEAGRLVGQLARLIGGGGGGRPELATAGGRKPENLDGAVGKAGAVLHDMLA